MLGINNRRGKDLLLPEVSEVSIHGHLVLCCEEKNNGRELEREQSFLYYWNWGIERAREQGSRVKIHPQWPISSMYHTLSPFSNDSSRSHCIYHYHGPITSQQGYQLGINFNISIFRDFLYSNHNPLSISYFKNWQKKQLWLHLGFAWIIPIAWLPWEHDLIASARSLYCITWPPQAMITNHYCR